MKPWYEAKQYSNDNIRQSDYENGYSEGMRTMVGRISEMVVSCPGCRYADGMCEIMEDTCGQWQSIASMFNISGKQTAPAFTDIEKHMILCITRSKECTTEDCKTCGWNKYEPCDIKKQEDTDGIRTS